MTKHFHLSEFQSGDGAPFTPTALARLPMTAKMLEVLRAELTRRLGRDCPLFVTSGYRSPSWNRKVGGVKNSYHLVGMAADITCKFFTPRQVQAVARALQLKGLVGGLGRYPGFTHVDTGPVRQWDETTRAEKGGAPR